MASVTKPILLDETMKASDGGTTKNTAQILLEIRDKIGSGSSGTTNYNDLTNKPQINGVTLTGNKTSSDLGIVVSSSGRFLSNIDCSAQTIATMPTTLPYTYQTGDYFIIQTTGGYKPKDGVTSIPSGATNIEWEATSQSMIEGAYYRFDGTNWVYDSSIAGKQNKIKFIEINTATGTLTTEQYSTLSDDRNNYIIYNATNILRKVYEDSTTLAYADIDNGVNITLEINISTKVYNVVSSELQGEIQNVVLQYDSGTLTDEEFNKLMTNEYVNTVSRLGVYYRFIKSSGYTLYYSNFNDGGENTVEINISTKAYTVNDAVSYQPKIKSVATSTTSGTFTDAQISTLNADYSNYVSYNSTALRFLKAQGYYSYYVNINESGTGTILCVLNRNTKAYNIVLYDLQEKIQYIAVTGTSGTLTAEQLALLQASKQNFVIYNSAYVLKLVNSDSTSLIYECLDSQNEITFEVNLSNREYIVETIPLAKKSELTEYNPTIPTGITPTLLENVKQGNNYYRVKHSETVLWENSSPTSAFGAQTITLSDNIDNYNYIVILFTKDNSAPYKYISEEIKIDGNDKQYFCSEDNVENSYKSSSVFSIIHQMRKVIISGSSAIVDDYSKYQLDIPADSSGSVVGVGNVKTSSTNIVPYKIIGIKL